MKLTDFSVLTFDCYGTLIDWESGIHAALQPLLERGGLKFGRDEVLAAFARHIGIYPGARAIEEFAAELAEFKTSKGAVQVQHEQALPLALLRRIVERRVARAAARTAKRSKVE